MTLDIDAIAVAVEGSMIDLRRDIMQGFRILAVVELSKAMPIDHAWRKLKEIEEAEPR